MKLNMLQAERTLLAAQDNVVQSERRLSQNVVRKRKNITLPLVLHGVFPVVEAKLAEPLEGEVRSVLSILRMLEASCLRFFLKFERSGIKRLVEGALLGHQPGVHHDR